MTREIFDQQIQRLQVRWRNAFDREFVSLLANRMNGISNDDFVEIVNFFIGNRPVSKPPLMQDFQDERIRRERQAFNRDVAGAASAMDRPWQGGLQAFLAREYPGCKTLNEAVEVQIEKNRIARAMGGE